MREPKPDFWCARCASDLQPAFFGSQRSCAFSQDGSFTPNNWSCATIEALIAVGDERADGDCTIEGDDESMQIIRPAPDVERGWLILTRYKHRGCTSSAVHVGDFWPPQPLTLALAETFLLSEPANDEPGRTP